MVTRWVTADHHFGHGNIIRFCSRPFDSALHMDQEMIRRWNEVVGPDDFVWHLGDFCLGGIKQARLYFGWLNGRISVVPGGHDRRWVQGADLMGRYHPVTIVDPLVHVTVAEQFIVLCHYPLESWQNMHYGSVHFHGHTHSEHNRPGRLNVCVDLTDFYPLRLEEAIRMAR